MGGLTRKDEEQQEYALFYAPLPPDSDHQNYVVLPPYNHRRRRSPRCCPTLDLHRCLCGAAAILVLAVVVYLLFPSDPKLTLVRVKINQIKIKTTPHLSLYLSLSLTLRVRNRDFFSLNYTSLAVSIGYRGREFGVVTSSGERIRARGSSYVDAELVVDGAEVIHDVIYLIEDLARGTIPFDTVSEVKGSVGLFFINFPIKTRVSCEVYVNINSQTVVRQDCYPA